MSPMTVRIVIVPALVAAVFFAACGDETPPPPPPQQQQAQKPAATPEVAVADAGTAEPAYVYAYSPVGKRDPFRSPIVKENPQEQLNCTGPLAVWDLDQLTLVATVTSDANPIGMVEDPTGKGYVIRRNTEVGRMCGKVTQVLRDCVTITEYIPQPDGKRQPNPKQLCLKGEQQGGGEIDLGTGKKF